MNNLSSHNLSLARAILLEPFGLDDAFISRVLLDVSSPVVDYADLYFQSRSSEGWSLDEGAVKTGNFTIHQGVGIRSVAGDGTAFAYTDDLARESILHAAAATKSIATAGGGAARIPSSKPLAVVHGRELYTTSDPTLSMDAIAKVKLLERIDSIARQRDSRVTRVMANIAAEFNVILIARNDGVIAADIRPMVSLSVSVVLHHKGDNRTGVGGGGGRFNYDYYSDEILLGYIDDAIRGASVNLEARPAPAGRMPVVLAAGWPGVMLHEAIGHGLEGDFNRKGSSSFAGRIGERVAAPGVTIVDDGTLPGRRGSLNIDDEGNKTQCTTLVEDGILTGYMTDSLNARLMNLPVSGNARRNSYSSLPLPRMTNTYMLNGDKDPDEIISSVKDGLYVKNLGGGQVDITNGKFVFSTTEAYLIKNGRVIHPVNGATLVGSGPESLKFVTMIGNDMKLDSGIGTCVKEGQTLPVGVGQPTLRIDDMTVGGTR
ncbi:MULTISPECIES: metalloprotease TldD [unclassified Brenneria]|uniref:metalloprotease TldD n=1 Tax=unclassified Brenneria TaxID=2634434 RepID=UPI0029C4D958|nr:MULTISPECIES: metalloprotease TldD [unclassified Brenneria]MDX5630851.1 metalloprotease TldD [Brenneria sp. L3-3Z]MDX5697933.1 metalloprotease TldD [Brenneria sp. L4-2C]